MKKNNIVIESAVATIESAVSHEISAGMIIVLNDKIRALQKKLTGKDGELVELSPVKIAAIEEEIEDCEKAITAHNATMLSFEETYQEVVTNMINAGNPRENVVTFLRLLAGIEQNKVMKFALPATEDLTALTEALNAIHVSGKYSNVGALTMTKEAKEAFKLAKEQVDTLIFNRFSLVETPYTKKLSVRFNSTDLGQLHDTYVTGIKNIFDKDGKFVERKITTRVKALKKNNAFSRFDGLKTIISTLVVEKICK